jgi:hypothetical protein
MTPDLARKLVPLAQDSTTALLARYVEYRIELAHKELEAASDLRTVGLAQGRIVELKKLLGLQDDIRARAKEQNG